MQKVLASILGALSKPSVQEKLLNFLRTKLIENFIVSVLKLSGFKYWIVSLLADKVLEEGDDKIVEPIFREVGFEGDVLGGAVVFKKLTNAKDIREWLIVTYDV